MGYPHLIMISTASLLTTKLLLLFLHFLCLSTYIHGSVDIKLTNKYALFNTGTIRDPSRVYNFTGDFADYRAKQISDIADWNGSIQANDALEFAEFVKIEQGNFTNQQKMKYGEKFEEIVENIKEFMIKNVHSLFLDYSTILEVLNKENELRPKHSNGKLVPIKLAQFGQMHNLVVACKLFMCQLMSEEGTGSWMDVFSLMNSLHSLERIYEISKMQSEGIDQAINCAIFEQHQQNNSTGVSARRKKQRAVIGGGGPAGLYATFRLFMAGMRVSMVNDRSNRYERNRVIFLDPKWINQLRFLLGTKFNQTFEDKEGMGELNRGDVGVISCRSLETVMSERLVELAKYVEERRAFEEQKTAKPTTNEDEDERPLLELIYNKAVTDIQRTEKGGERSFYAVTGKSERTKGSKREKEKDEMRDETISSGNLKRQKTDIKYPKIPVDLLIFAGGKNDKMRRKFLGEQQDLTSSLYYGATSLTRGSKLPKLFPEQMLFLEGTPMTELAPHLGQRALYDFVVRMAAPSSNKGQLQFSTEFLEKYKDMKKIIFEGGEKVLNLRIFQIKKTVNIGYPMPKQLSEFFKDIEQEKVNKTESQQQKAIENFRISFIRLWSAALIDFALNKSGNVFEGHKVINLDTTGQIGPFDEGKLNFDTEPVNVGVGAFSTHVMAVDEAVAEMGGEKSEENANEENYIDGSLALMAAIGDSNTSYFLRASGFSTARMSVEYLANEIRDFNRGILTKQQLIKVLKQKLNSIKNRAIKLVEDYIKPLPGKEHLLLPPPSEDNKP